MKELFNGTSISLIHLLKAMAKPYVFFFIPLIKGDTGGIIFYLIFFIIYHSKFMKSSGLASDFNIRIIKGFSSLPAEPW